MVHTFRDYEAEARASVKALYRENHRRQTWDFVAVKRHQFLGLKRRQMGIWEAMTFLDQLVDDSDPDTEISQLEHLVQAAESARRDGQPDWMVLTALIHDLGKVLCLFGEPQWAVVGDTFPVGCAHDPVVVYPEFFAGNPDTYKPQYEGLGRYEEGCGLENVHMSWGHDEYLFHVVKDYLPEQAAYVIRYHSFYAAHSAGGYEHLMNDRDRKLMPAVRAFNLYDLYSKADEPPEAERLRPYYEALVERFFPASIRW